jgi:TolA-binding protein
MTRTRIGLTLGAFVLGLIAFSAVGYAQTGRLKGKVVDAQNKPIEGAQITLESKEMNRKLNTKTDKRGEYTQFLAPGTYVVTASKDNMSQTFEVRVSHDEKEMNIAMKPGSGGPPVSDADRKKAEAEKAALTGAFEQGVALSNEGKFDEAVAKFNEVAAKIPKCVEC